MSNMKVPDSSEGNRQSATEKGDEVPPGTPQSADGLCPRCGGSGKVANVDCTVCGGSGM
jgi:DnaJ-class molecular chaperone